MGDSKGAKHNLTRDSGKFEAEEDKQSRLESKKGFETHC